MAPKVAGKKGEKRAGKAKAPSDGKKKRRGKRKESYAIYGLTAEYPATPKHI